MKKKVFINGDYFNIHCYALNYSNMRSTHCPFNTNCKVDKEGTPFLFTNKLGFIVEFVYMNKFYCFHLESDCLNDSDDGYWNWWYEFDEFGNPAESSNGKGNLSFEIRGGYAGNQPAMINLEINIYHDGIYVQNEQIRKFNVLEISRKKCYV
ncbi:MAG: hypothetical protein IKO86_07260 [Prevotella sp.]|nr:hypothetical protein [Prevotella sp.]